MPSVNQVTLIGYLGKEPEMIISQKGTPVTTLSLGTNRGKQTTDWHKVVCFGDIAEFVNGNANKGDMLYVSGSMQYSVWESEGRTNKQASIMGDKVFILQKGRNYRDTEIPEDNIED
jgi:single-strand DNA-binding protein